MSITSIDSLDILPSWESLVRRAVRSLRFGSVEIVVHDGRVVQVETREKVRFPERPPDDRRHWQLGDRPDRMAGGAASTTREENE